MPGLGVRCGRQSRRLRRRRPPVLRPCHSDLVFLRAAIRTRNTRLRPGWSLQIGRPEVVDLRLQLLNGSLAGLHPRTHLSDLCNESGYRGAFLPTVARGRRGRTRTRREGVRTDARVADRPSADLATPTRIGSPSA